MKTAVGFTLAFLLFSAGIQGRMGSMLAVFIDPGALIDISGAPPTTPDALASANQLADTYANLNGGVRPKPTVPPDTLNQCPAGYTYNYQLQQCVFSGVVRRHA